jgi:3,4-dihydroxy-2-butanone 4-phosphate synthase
MNDDGSMARMPQLQEFSEKHNIGICTIEDLIEYRMRKESFVYRAAETIIPTTYGGDFKAIVFENHIDDLNEARFDSWTIEILSSLTGDYNHDNAVNIGDIIFGLKQLSGINDVQIVFF